MGMTGIIVREGRDVPLLRDLTTIRLGGRALAAVALQDEESAAALPEIAERLGGKLVSLGAGSNILAKDGDLPLVLVKNALEPEIAVLTDDGEEAVLRAGGSVKLPVLLAYLAAMNFAGLEGLAGIPGTVGGAVAMNAGSYGQCIADTLASVTVVTQTRAIRAIPRADIDFGYRRMAFSGSQSWHLTLSAEFRLARMREAGIISARGKENMAKKAAVQPVSAASAGCVFKNPVGGISAGKLLDEAGFRGKRLGGMAFSAMHANFLINEGGGTSAQAFELLAMAREGVRAKFGISLQTEVTIWA